MSMANRVSPVERQALAADLRAAAMRLEEGDLIGARDRILPVLKVIYPVSVSDAIADKVSSALQNIIWNFVRKERR